MSDWHECPVKGCKVKVPRNKLMCGPHWAQVPDEQQRAVQSQWNGGNVGRRGATAGGYMKARQACIDSVNAQAKMSEPSPPPAQTMASGPSV